MKYFDKIRELTKLIPTSIVDFSQPRDRTSPPTQASSNFITNKEQGDWAEDLIFRAINKTSTNYVAVKYGKSDDLIAGEEGFEKFYNQFQDELDTMGKRPEIEDIKVVYKWIEKFNVSHYYFQVFFDKYYGISFENILSLLTEPEKEGEYYEISKDVKNQNKTTVKINTRKTQQVAYKIIEPEHSSVRREMGRGRLLFYVTFDKGTAYLDIDSLKSLLNIENF